MIGLGEIYLSSVTPERARNVSALVMQEIQRHTAESQQARPREMGVFGLLDALSGFDLPVDVREHVEESVIKAYARGVAEGGMEAVDGHPFVIPRSILTPEEI